jgi:hypothetical protein
LSTTKKCHTIEKCGGGWVNQAGWELPLNTRTKRELFETIPNTTTILTEKSKKSNRKLREIAVIHKYFRRAARRQSAVAARLTGGLTPRARQFALTRFPLPFAACPETIVGKMNPAEAPNPSSFSHHPQG